MIELGTLEFKEHGLPTNRLYVNETVNGGVCLIIWNGDIKNHCYLDIEQKGEFLKLFPQITSEIKRLKERNAKLDSFARLMMKTLEQIEECSDIPEHITDSVADILADWSEE